MSSGHKNSSSSNESDASWRESPVSYGSGFSGRYEWIWDSADRARHLPSSPRDSPSPPPTDDDEESSFIRGGSRLEDYLRIKKLEAIILKNEQEIYQLNDLFNITEWDEQNADAMTNMMADGVAGIASAYVDMGVELWDARKIINLIQVMAVVLMDALILGMWM